MAARLPAGNLASLKYASNLVGAVLSIFATALGTASLPYLSDMAARKDWRAMRASLRHYSWLVLWASVPIALGGWWLSESVIRLVYERGEFRAQDSATVGECFAMYALQIPFYTLGMLASRVLSALKHNALLLRVAALNLALNIVFNLWFLRLFGIAGIALSTAAVYAVSTAILLVLALRKLRLQETLG
jgi:putative peptidoglycan lipid II flippase